MKFGVLQFFSWPERRVELRTVYRRALDRIQTMDANGFDAVWLAEHHFSTYSVCPSVHVMAMHAADMTKNLRIGTGVSLAAFYHPLRLAEEVALLDNLTDGRINWGAGRGFDSTEFRAFSVPQEESTEKFREHVEIVLKAWEQGSFSFRGKYHTFDEIEVLPKPVQQPMPFWIASTSTAAIEWSGSKGYAILMDPHASHQEIAEKYQLYQNVLKQHDFGMDQDTPMARLIAIGKSDEEAYQVARSGAQWMFSGYFNASAGGRTASTVVQETRLEDYVANTVVHGTSERVADTLIELKETIPMNYLLAAPLSHRSFTLLTEEVMPRIM